MNKKTMKEIIRSVADGDKKMMSFPNYTADELRRRYMTFFSRASEINKEEGWKHYRLSLYSELGMFLIIAERRLEDGAGNRNEA